MEVECLSHTLKPNALDRPKFWAHGADVRSISGDVNSVITYILEDQGAPLETYLA